jgi:hypothetical protein
MALNTGDKVVIKPLNRRKGRVLGGQQTSKADQRILYLVRYEVAIHSPVDDSPAAYSTTGLYFRDELSRDS